MCSSVWYVIRDLFISLSSRSFTAPSWPSLILFSTRPIPGQIPSSYNCTPVHSKSRGENDLYLTFQMTTQTTGRGKVKTQLHMSKRCWMGGSVHPPFFRQKWKEPWNGNGRMHAWLPQWITDNIRQSVVRISKGDFAHKRRMDTCWHLSGDGHVSGSFCDLAFLKRTQDNL